MTCLHDLSLTAEVAFTEFPGIADDLDLPPLVVRGVTLDGLSRERLLYHTERHLAAAFGSPVQASFDDEPGTDTTPVIVAEVGGHIAAVGSVCITREPRQGAADEGLGR